MSIHKPKIYGTCSGSKKALDLAFSLEGKNVVVFKEILHNKEIIEKLKKIGIETVDSLPLDKEVILRAHGEPKEIYDFLHKNNIKYYDATCVNVKRVQKIIKEYYEKNYKIVIIGHKNHPEVIGENGWCNNEAYIIDCADDVVKIDGKILVVCQTTIGTKQALEIVDKIKEINKEVKFINTICKAQEMIQKSACDLAKEMDLMIVVGGKNSSNTRELYNVCKEYCESILVSSIEDVKGIKNNKLIGITGGASTPHEQIEKIIFRIENNK